MDTQPKADQRGKRIVNRVPWLDLPAPFDNLRIRAWLDYPQEVAELWTAPETKPDGTAGETREEQNTRILEACKNVFLEHDGWEDEDGLLPGPETDEFWQRISTQLGKAIVTRFFEELTGNPTFRASRRTKPASSRSR
jgi:hypothetical protein